MSESSERIDAFPRGPVDDADVESITDINPEHDPEMPDPRIG